MTNQDKLNEIGKLLDQAKELLLVAYEDHLAATGQERTELPKKVEEMLLPRDMNGNLFEVGRGPLNDVR